MFVYDPASLGRHITRLVGFLFRLSFMHTYIHIRTYLPIALWRGTWFVGLDVVHSLGVWGWGLRNQKDSRRRIALVLELHATVMSTGGNDQAHWMSHIWIMCPLQGFIPECNACGCTCLCSVVFSNLSDCGSLFTLQVCVSQQDRRTGAPYPEHTYHTTGVQQTLNPCRITG